MIVVFVVDTSPSMGLAINQNKMEEPSSSSVTTPKNNNNKGMSRLDLAKMVVEGLEKGLDKRILDYNKQQQQQSQQPQQSAFSQNQQNQQILLYPPDQFLLLSTGRQDMKQPGTITCGAGGRLLVGFINTNYKENLNNDVPSSDPQRPSSQFMTRNHGTLFERELKRLKVNTNNDSNSNNSSSSSAGTNGLNIALSTGLQLLSKYRLQHRSIENFGMGFPLQNQQQQSACLILITDGECLAKNGNTNNSLQLQFGTQPLKELYKEPFRWDQRFFCVTINSSKSSGSMHMHSSLRALCEVTGGGYVSINNVIKCNTIVDTLIKQISPIKLLPIIDPLLQPKLQLQQQSQQLFISSYPSTFVNGGPVCTFSKIDNNPNSNNVYRASLLYVPSQKISDNGILSSKNACYNYVLPNNSPIWCIPESHFPNKKLDILPPRTAQPMLSYTKNFNSTFDPYHVMKLLHHLDKLILSNKQYVINASSSEKQNNIPIIKLLQRDVYTCEWIRTTPSSSATTDENKSSILHPWIQRGQEYLPISIRGAGRPSDSNDHYNLLHIGVLHIPYKDRGDDKVSNSNKNVSTITLVPPNPHLLLPLLISAADIEHRALKKFMDKWNNNYHATTDNKDNNNTTNSPSITAIYNVIRNITLDDNWQKKFRSYLYTIPPYYILSLRRSLKPILPTSVHPLLQQFGIVNKDDNNVTLDNISSLCFSRNCYNKIRQGELLARQENERLERQEEEIRRRGGGNINASAFVDHDQHNSQLHQNTATTTTDESSNNHIVIGYGQYDPRSTVSSYLSALRTMPPPWKVNQSKGPHGIVSSDTQKLEQTQKLQPKNPLKNQQAISTTTSSFKVNKENKTNVTINNPPTKVISVTDTIGELPAKCLLAYYESRRRWIHGGPSLTTKGISVEGVDNDGENVHVYNKNHSMQNESLLSIAGVGASMTHQSPITKMGDFRERLLFSNTPVVAYGGSSMASCSAATVAANGSPQWSVDDDALPHIFFDPKNGKFSGNMQTRVKARIAIHFGNPFKDKRGDSVIPENFQHQRPPANNNIGNNLNEVAPGSPPHSFDDDLPSAEGEGEANHFAGKVPSPPRSNKNEEDVSSNDDNTPPSSPGAKKRKSLLLSEFDEESPAKKAMTHKLRAPPPKPASKPPAPPSKPAPKLPAPPSKPTSKPPAPPSKPPNKQASKPIGQHKQSSLEKEAKATHKSTKSPPPPPPPRPPKSSSMITARIFTDIVNRNQTPPPPPTSSSTIAERLKGAEKTKPQPPLPPKCPSPSVITARLNAVETKNPPPKPPPKESTAISHSPSIITNRLQSSPPVPPPQRSSQQRPQHSALTDRLKQSASPQPPPPPPPAQPSSLNIAPSVLSKRLKVSSSSNLSSQGSLKVAPSMLSARLKPSQSLSVSTNKDPPPPPQIKESSSLSLLSPPQPLTLAPSMLSARLKSSQPSSVSANKNPPPPPSPQIKEFSSHSMLSPPLPPQPLTLAPSMISERLNSSQPSPTPTNKNPPPLHLAPSMISERLNSSQSSSAPTNINPPPLNLAPSMLSKRLKTSASPQSTQSSSTKDPPTLKIAPSMLSSRLKPPATQQPMPSSETTKNPPTLKIAPSMLSARLNSSSTPPNPPKPPPDKNPPPLSLSPSILSQPMPSVTSPQQPPPLNIAPSMLSERLKIPPSQEKSTTSKTNIAPSLLSERLKISEKLSQLSSTKSSVATSSQQQQVDLQNPDVKPSVNLPSGWICVWSKSQKRWYFFDTRTNKSVWQWPPP